ncbi:amidohydrolase [Marinifilum sp. RC60d5]|uniref:amidohydrolase n=1 Tax=Marinifilum sp. RC60d5 TaxID=3458414 RepID=UPI004034FCEC
MSDLLKICLVQTKLVWGDVEANLNHFSNLFHELKESPDLLVLPEMFTSGFLMENKEAIAQKANYTLAWMKNQATKLEAVVLGSIIVKENTDYFNRLYVIDSSGVICTYDKRHLFRMGEEHLHFAAGNQRSIFKIGKWRICPLICYDLRFPVWSRNSNEYDLLIYVANWPSARRAVWNTLLQARAIENQSYVVGVNRVGSDAQNLTYTGDSCLIDAKGKILQKAKENESEIIFCVIDRKELNDFRMKFPVLFDADLFQIEE